MERLYKPFDHTYDRHCLDTTVLFLPPSRENLGILSKTIPQLNPLELSPCEYVGVAFEGSDFIYCRSNSGYKGFLNWIFNEEGDADLSLTKHNISINFNFKIQGNLIFIHTSVLNKSLSIIETMYINPCLRYQNISDFHGIEHSTIFLYTDDKAIPLSKFVFNNANDSRILTLHEDIYKTGIDGYRRMSIESLMKSRFMQLSSSKNMNSDNTKGLLLGYDKPFSFFSRVAVDGSRCMHVIPLFENISPGEIQHSTGIILWGDASHDVLNQNFIEAMKINRPHGPGAVK